MIHHVALTASNLSVSTGFYDFILGALGYQRTHDSDEISVWEGPNPEVLLYAAKPEQRENRHRTYDPGVHHLAFAANTRGIVDLIEKGLVRAGGRLLDSAREYPEYSETYYAVFFEDPDSIKIEVMNA